MVAVGVEARGPGRHRGALPAAPNTLVGRDQELGALVELLAGPTTRLVTLTGPPGVGKTRLAVAAAAAAADRFPGGVVFVDLTAIRDPGLVAGELAGALRESGKVPGNEPALAVVDNVDHVLDAGPDLAAACETQPWLRLLVTSRERLHLRAEREVPVHPLALPSAADTADPERFAATASVAMLLQRIGAFDPGFTVTPANREALAEICIRLDGLPLALELAAARLKLFTPGELTFRLRHRMALLTAGARDVPDRHRTLQAALAWSHNLLNPQERALFRRLSVFVGRWTLEAAQQVCAVEDVVETMASLVDKSLVRRRTGPGEIAEFTMLESMREYGADLLAEHGEEAETRDRHARYFAELGARAEAMIGTGDEAAALTDLGLHEGNLRAALDHTTSGADVVRSLLLAGAFGWYCHTHGRIGEGRAAVDRALGGTPSDGSVPDGALAGALLVAGIIAIGHDEPDRAEALLSRAMRIDPAARRAAVGNAFLGHLARTRGRHAAAVAHHERAGALYEELDCPVGVAWSRYDLGLLARGRGECGEAARHLRVSLDRFREVGHPWAVACVAWALATVHLRRRRTAEAAVLLDEALENFEAVGDDRGAAQCLEAAATLLTIRGEYAGAARLLGAAAVVRDRLAVPLPDEDRDEIDAVVQQVQQALGADATARADRAGRATPCTVAVTLARELVTGREAVAERSRRLTRREREVAHLVARGRTNRQIGRELGIAEKTTEVHVHHIIRKLGARSRAEVAAWVAGQQHG